MPERDHTDSALCRAQWSIRVLSAILGVAILGLAGCVETICEDGSVAEASEECAPPVNDDDTQPNDDDAADDDDTQPNDDDAVDDDDAQPNDDDDTQPNDDDAADDDDAVDDDDAQPNDDDTADDDDNQPDDDDAANDDDTQPDDDDAQPNDDDGADDDDAVAPEPMAHSLAVVVNQDVDVAPTPITQLYLDRIDATVSGEEIVSLQKYFKNQAITEALIAAVQRGVDVTAIYRDEVDPTCETLASDPAFDCASTFIQVNDVHHKNLMVLGTDGSVQAIVGSYNLRERDTSDPRAHTVLSFEVEPGSDVWTLYRGEADRLLLGADPGTPMTVTLPAEDGGELQLQLHPHTSNPVAELLQQIDGCVGPLWLSWFTAFPDTTGTPVVDEVARLVGLGCDARLLLEDDLLNEVMALSFAFAGGDARNPVWTTSADGLLGHKIVAVETSDTSWLTQGSANLTVVDQQTTQHNLTISLQGPSSSPTYGAMQSALRDELARYW